MKTLYEAKATATGGRNGHVRSSDGIIDLDLSIPKGLGGPGKPLPMLFEMCQYRQCGGPHLLRSPEVDL